MKILYSKHGISIHHKFAYLALVPSFGLEFDRKMHYYHIGFLIYYNARFK